MPQKRQSPAPPRLTPEPPPAPADIKIRFWGTRGTVVPELDSPVFGIHTTCLEVCGRGGSPFFVDLGTGAVRAARDALARGIRKFDFWLTHLHSDHVAGMFAFAPFYRADCTIRIFSAAREFEKWLRAWFSPPFHPLSFEQIAATVSFHPMPASGERDFPEHGLALQWGPVPHPQGCTALRFSAGASSFVFGTDVEIRADGHGGHLERLLAHPFPAGLAAVDGFFMDSEIHKFPDWGHSSWKEAWELCGRTGVETLLVTHHHPANADEVLQAMEAATPGPIHWARESVAWALENNHARRI